MPYYRTVPYVDLRKFLGTWYIVAGRTSAYEKGAHNSIETYRWNAKKKRIDIHFSCRQNSFEGKEKQLRQKAWIEDLATNARWKVRQFWPLEWEYLIIALASDYAWAAIGVPNQKHLWILSEDPEMSDLELKLILRQIEGKGYSTREVIRIPQKHTVPDRIRLHTLDAAS